MHDVYYFIYQYIYPGWACYKNCILPQRPAENKVKGKKQQIYLIYKYIYITARRLVQLPNINIHAASMEQCMCAIYSIIYGMYTYVWSTDGVGSMYIIVIMQHM